MAILMQSPQCALHAAYSPSVWIFVQHALAGEEPPALRVDYNINTLPYKSAFVSPIESASQGGNVIRYTFEIDAQEVLQSYFENSDTLPPINEGILVSGFSAEFFIEVTTYLDNAGDGYVRELPTTKFKTQSYFAINSYRQGQEEYCLDEYSIPVINRPWLTRLNNSIELCLDSNFWLSAYNGSAGLVYLVTTYNKDGVVLNSGIMATSTSANQIQVLGVGAVNINDSAALFPFGTPVTIDENVSYYEIYSGYITLGGSIDVNPIFTIHLTNKCCEYQLIFLNSFGVYECLNVQKEQILNYRVNGSVFTSARLMPTEANYLLSRGKNYISKQGVNVLQFSLPHTRDSMHDWYRDFFNSPDVYLYKKGDEQMIPVTTNVGNFNIKSNHGLTITVEWSNKDYSQRN